MFKSSRMHMSASTYIYAFMQLVADDGVNLLIVGALWCIIIICNYYNAFMNTGFGLAEHIFLLIVVCCFLS